MARANASRPPPCRRSRGSARAARRLRGRLEEGGDVRVDLRDDELRDVKELREPVQRQVRPQRAVHVLGACGAGGGHVVDTPAGGWLLLARSGARRVHRHDAAAAVFRHQGRRPHDARQRARGCDGGVDEHVWRGDVVQQDGLAFAAPAARRRGDRDVDVPARRQRRLRCARPQTRRLGRAARASPSGGSPPRRSCRRSRRGRCARSRRT